MHGLSLDVPAVSSQRVNEKPNLRHRIQVPKNTHTTTQSRTLVRYISKQYFQTGEICCGSPPQKLFHILKIKDVYTDKFVFMCVLHSTTHTHTHNYSTLASCLWSGSGQRMSTSGSSQAAGVKSYCMPDPPLHTSTDMSRLLPRPGGGEHGSKVISITYLNNRPS